MLNKFVAPLLTVIACASCAQTPPLTGDLPKPPPVPSALVDKPALSPTPLNERVENSLRKFDASLTKARR